MTIHKSKGLEFNYVIFPYAEKVGVFKCETRWARPEVKGTALDGFADGVYSVCLSEQSENTLFGPAYRQEKRLQYIDNINTFYVALTRAARGLHVLAALPSEKCREACKDGSDFVFTDMSQLLYWHCGGVVDFRTGAFPDFPREGKTASATGVAAGYASFPLGDRLRVKSDAADFFGADGTVGTEASPRLRGVVLHGILSRVRVPADLDAALEDACSAGLLSETEQAAAESLLRARIDAAARRGWFPDDASAVRNEAPVLSPEGTFRPDRVVFSDGAVTVVDYKFGHPEPSYALQVRRYMDLYRRMGYGQVRGYLWYVFSDKVEEILP
jgi:ATP-dependent exoDNAse (exonuclease V) beta subunit